MDTINVVFAFDENYVTQGLIAALSLLDSAQKKRESCRYRIFFLTDAPVSSETKSKFLAFLMPYENLDDVKFVVSRGSFFKGGYASRHVTKSAFLRLEIPELLDLDRVIYSDVDVLYLSGLEELWSVDLGDFLLAAVVDVGFNREVVFERKRRELDYWDKYFAERRGSYFQDGLMLMNLRQMRETRVFDRWREFLGERFEYQEMDIINITCYPLIKKIGTKYSIIPGYFKRGRYDDGVVEGFLTSQEVKDARENPVIIHYAGAKKPWNTSSALGCYEYWGFLERFPALEKELLDKYDWSWFDRFRKKFIAPLF